MMAWTYQVEVGEMETRQRCPHCGSNVESLAFCGVCGHRLHVADRPHDDSLRGRLDAALLRIRARPLGTVLVVASLVIFLLLLGGQAGIATLVALLVAPYVLLSWLTRLDLYEREPWPLLGSVLGGGALLGLLGGWLASEVFARFWFDDTRLNLGAIGFAGISANGEGGVPFGVLLLDGLVIPILTGAAVLAGPILLRRWPVFRNELSDGMTLGALAAAGFATLSSFVFFWPSVFDDLPDRPVEEWTAILAGTVVLRPVVLILAGSLLGIAAWQYAATRDLRPVILAGAAGVFGWLALPLGSLVLTQSGAVAEFVWYLVAAVVVGFLFRVVLNPTLERDRAVLATSDGQQRVVCPNCGQVTPDGTYCAFCRAPLHEPVPAALDPDRDAAPSVAADDGQPVLRPVMATRPDPPEAADVASASDRAPTTDREAFMDWPETTTTSEPPTTGESGSRTAWVAGAGASRSAEHDWSLRDVVDEPEADPLDYLLTDEAEPPPVNAASGAATGDPQTAFAAPEPARAADEAEATLDDADVEQAVSEGIGPATDEEDQGLLPTDESTAPELPIDRLPPGEPGAGASGDRRASPESPWSNVRPFRGASVLLDQDKPTSRLTWMPGGTREADRGPADRADGLAPAGSPSSDVDDASSIENTRAGGETEDSSPTAGVSDSASPARSPVSSSSGRWFEASSNRPGESGATTSLGADDELSSDQAGQSSTDTATTPDLEHGDDQSRLTGVDLGPDDASEHETDEALPMPAGLRWLDRVDAEPDVPEPDATDSAPDLPVSFAGDQTDVDGLFSQPSDAADASEPDPSDYAGSASTAPSSGPEPEPAAEPGQRTGLWRQITRQVRPAAPRTPPRDGDGQQAPGTNDDPDGRGR